MSTQSRSSTYVIVGLCGVICVLTVVVLWPKSPLPPARRPVLPLVQPLPLDTIATDSAFALTEADILAAIRKHAGGIKVAPLNAPGIFSLDGLPVRLAFQKTRTGDLADISFTIDMVRTVPLVSRNGRTDDALVNELLVKLLSPVEAVIHALDDATLDSKLVKVSAVVKDCMGNGTGNQFEGEKATLFVSRIDVGSGAKVVISFSPLVFSK